MATDIDYALMAGRVYQGTRGQINWLPDLQSLGWTEFFPQTNASGFEAISFQKVSEIVISFAGTGSGVDWWANAGGVFGVTSDQLKQAADYYLQVQTTNPNAAISFTGHSLGGGLSSLMAVFFGRNATTFDQAPFRNSANVAVAATLKDYLLNQRGYSAVVLQGLTDFISTSADGAISGESNVRDFSVQGEILSAVSGLRIGTPTTLTHGAPDVSLTLDLHSQALLTAFLQSSQTSSAQQSLRDVTFKLPDVVRMIFDKSLFVHSTEKSNTTDDNFIERLVRHQNGVAGLAPGEVRIAADAMLTRFTSDLWKLAQESGLTLTDGNAGFFSSATNNVSKTLMAFAMQMYYEDTANATNADKRLFGDVTGGIQFDMADVSKTFVTALQNSEKLNLTDAKGFDLYFKDYLASSSFTGSERQLIQSMLPYMRDWYVQAGANGLANTDILSRGAFMLGGTGSDALVGGSAADLLVGNAGDDVLMGGKGNDTLIGGKGADTYIFQSADGRDTLLDSDGQGSIVHGGDTLTGGAQYGDNRVYRSADKKHLYVLANDSTLLIDGQIVVEGYNKARGDLGIAYGDAPIQVDPVTISPPIKGDLKPLDNNPNQDGDQLENDDLGNVRVGTEVEAGRVDTLRDSAGNDYITSGGGNDVVYTTLGGDNKVETGSGRDWVYGGAGKDLVMGGADADILQGGGGDDRLYADAQVTVAQAIASGNSQSGSGSKGDWLAGNAGDDILAGAADDDVLTGGAGADLLIGGAGNDDILGDSDWVPTSQNWSVVDEIGRREFKPVTGAPYPADFGADVIYAGEGNDHAWGGRGDDVLFGEAGDDIMVGNGDNDALFGGAGKDILLGDWISLAGEIEAHMGDDYLDGGADDDELGGGAGNDILIGGTGADTLIGGAGQDIYIFNKGDGTDTVYDTKSDSNIFRFGEGVKSSDITLRLGSLLLDMGNGDKIHIDNFNQRDVYNSVAIDSFQFADGSTLSSSQLLARGFDIDGTELADMRAGTNITDRMRGLGGNDVLLGDGGADMLYGGAGDDELQGDAADLAGQYHGNDYLNGEDGDDRIWGDGGADTLFGGAGNDTLYGDADLEELEAQFHGNDALDGGDGDDRLDGGGGNDMLLGGAGNDNLIGGTGNDTLIGGAGADTLNGGNGDDSYQAGAGDTVTDEGGINTLSLVDGEPYAVAAIGADLVLGYDGGNVRLTGALTGSISSIDGTALSDWLQSRLTQSVDVTGTYYSQTLTGGAGNDLLTAKEDRATTLLGGNGHDTLVGSSDNDTLIGGSGNDVLRGGGGNDVIDAGEGDDLIYASQGADTLSGGAGMDTYRMGYSTGQATLTDNSAEGSVIELDTSGLRLQSLTAKRSNDDLLVQVRGTDTSLRIKDFYGATQTSWVFKDADGNALSAQALIDASKPQWDNLLSNLLREFKTGVRNSVAPVFLEQGYTQDANGNWMDPSALSSLETHMWTNTIREQHSVTWTTHTSLADPSISSTWETSNLLSRVWVRNSWEQNTVGFPVRSVVFEEQEQTVYDENVTLQSMTSGVSLQSAWRAVSEWSLIHEWGQQEFRSSHSYVWSPVGAPALLVTDSARSVERNLQYQAAVGELRFENPGEAALAGPLPDFVSVGIARYVQNYNLGQTTLSNGNHTVTADRYAVVIGGVGNNTIYGAGFAFGGTGSARLIGGDTLMAGTGNQYLENGKTMVVGDGHDTVVGKAPGRGYQAWNGSSWEQVYDQPDTRILVDPNNTGMDLLVSDANSQPDKNSDGVDDAIEAIYRGQGIRDVRESYWCGGKFASDGDFPTYFDTREQAYDYFVSIGSTRYEELRYVPPLSVLLRGPGLNESFENWGPPSDYYAAHPLQTIVLTANDFSALQPHLDAGLLPMKTVSFGQGLSLGDINLSWGVAVSPVDGGARITLNLQWGPDQGLRVMIPRADDALNGAVGKFEFADGSVVSLGALIGMAPPAPGFDMASAQFYAGMGHQIVAAGMTTGIYAGSVATADISVQGDGVDLVISMNGGLDSLRLMGWYSNPVTRPSTLNLEFADGTVWQQSDLDAMAGPIFTGTEGDDALLGADSTDTLQGLTGDDTLDGGSGDDVYLFKRGDGADTIFDYDESVGNIDTLRFDGTVSVAEVKVTRDDFNLYLSVGGTTDHVTLKNWFVSDASMVEQVEFADGTVWQRGALAAMAMRVFMGTEGDDDLNGTDGDEALQGLGGSDVLMGGKGNDVYLFKRGDGADTIIDDDETVGNIDTVRFDGTVAVADIQVTRGYSSLYLSIDGTTDRLTFSNWFESDANWVERFEFAHGEVWSAAMLESLIAAVPATEEYDELFGTSGADVLSGLGGDDEIYGSGGNDTLDGGAGEDFLDGGVGNDVYLFGRGSGWDYIEDYDELVGNIDTLRFDSSVSVGDVTVTRDEFDLFLSFPGGEERIKIYDWFYDPAYAVERVEFFGGTVWQQADIAAMALTQLVGTEDDDVLTGTADNELLDGGAGADTMAGGAGNDTYVVDAAGDVVTERANEGSDTVRSVISYRLGAHVENLTLSGIDAINATGNSLNNVLTGNAANNILNGAAGADTMQGRAGDDSYYVDNTGDSVTEAQGEGTDRVISSISYTLGDHLEDLQLSGTAAVNATGNAHDNKLTGNSGANTLTGRAGDDRLTGGLGADQMLGGEGDDLYEVDNTADVVIELAGEGTDTVESTVTYTLASDVENLILTGLTAIDGTGNALNNVLQGNVADNLLSGGAGNDSLNGMKGLDTLAGGAGNDSYLFEDDLDAIVEEANGGRDTLISRISAATLAANLEDGVLLGSAASLTGNELSNVLTGNNAANTLDGGAGADVLIGGKGNDVYLIDSQADTVVENAAEGTDTVQAGVNYSLGDNLEHLTLTGTAEAGMGNELANKLTGNASANKLWGQAGNDQLDGGLGADILIGGLGHDKYWVDSSDDLVVESALEGTDTVYASVSYALADNVEYLTLTGSANINAIGNAGNNRLEGNTGNNILFGGLGNDTYVFGRGSGHDIIANFDAGKPSGDMVQLGAGIVDADISLLRQGDDLVLSINGSPDQLTVASYFENGGKGANALEKIRFADGSSLNHAAVLSRTAVDSGTSEAQALPAEVRAGNPAALFDAPEPAATKTSDATAEPLTVAESIAAARERFEQGLQNLKYGVDEQGSFSRSEFAERRTLPLLWNLQDALLDMQLAKNPDGRFTADISMDSRGSRDLGLAIGLLGGAGGMSGRLDQVARPAEVQQFDLAQMQ